MKISIANDHNGVKVKKNIIEYLSKLNHEIIDFGSQEGESADYPEYAFKVGKSVTSKESELGILICGTGIGMSIACNKIRGIRCAKVSSCEEARLTREHNNANVLAISSKMSMLKTRKIVSIFVSTNFSNVERHIRRNNLIDNYVD